jgi:ribulose-5-phosphate 4-epimerase/fuculose-1-phosphate aldolase
MSTQDHRELRIELACAFRWAARLGMHEATANHFSVATSADGAQFLINPNGSHFSRIRASDLLLLDAGAPDPRARPDAIGTPDAAADTPDATAWALHSAIHRRGGQSRCVLHVHSKYATTLACLADSTLPPIDQNSMRFFERVTIDAEFDGMGLGDEAERVSRLAGDRPILLMGNHGVIVTGPSIAQAFDDLYYFERACETYITALSTGRPLRVAPTSVARRTCKQWTVDYAGSGELHFHALRRILDAEEPTYAR